MVLLFCSNSDEEYYDEECINLFLETLKRSEKNVRNFFKLETSFNFTKSNTPPKFPPEIYEIF